MREKSLKFLSVFLCAVFMLGGCREASQSTQTIANGSFGGIAFDTQSRTAGSAVPIPDITTTIPDDFIENSEQITTVSSESTTSYEKNTESIVTSEQESTTPITVASTLHIETTTTTIPVSQIPETSSQTTSETTTSVSTTERISETTVQAENISASYTFNSYKALNYSEMKGVWISYLEIATLLKGKSESDFRAGVKNIYSNCLQLGLNTVYVHARAFGDAFYNSDLFPFSKHISGQYGLKTSYDPLEIMVEEAHKQGLSIHAWINPLRLCSASELSAVSDDYPIKKWYNDSSTNGTYIVNVNGTFYLNPAYDETVRLVGNGVREIVSGYDVDGVHIDDYFYPTTDTYFDSKAFSDFGGSSLSAFRIANCNKLVKEIYNAVNECSETAVFGISTQGNMSNNLNQLYADAQAWCSGGYVDYFAPQIYYGFENSAQPFKTCTDQWNELVEGTNVKLAIGLSVYKVGTEDKWAGSGAYEWVNTDSMLKRQIEYARSCKNYGGFALYSYNYLFTNGYLTNTIKREIENFKPLIKE